MAGILSHLMYPGTSTDRWWTAPGIGSNVTATSQPPCQSRGAIGIRDRHGRSDGGMPRATVGTASPGPDGMASRRDPGVAMSSRDERGDARRHMEDLMREVPPPSVVGDVEDAVAEEVEGELTPW